MEQLFMQISANASLLLRGKKFILILGLVFLLIGFSLIVVYSFVIKPDTMLLESVQMTTTDDHVSPTFHAEEGDWLKFALMSSNSSILRLRRSLHGEVWRIDNFNQQGAVNGAVYNFTSYINGTDDYTLSLENYAAQCYYPYLSNYGLC
jgi:hypothetical protein